ncbi:MAG: TolC family protein [Deltaproteobacteria bacterium]|nr:TolC family protein [Deltaproteobacteria bacterium]
MAAISRAVNTALLVLALAGLPAPARAQAGGTPPTAGSPPPILAGRVIPLTQGAEQASKKGEELALKVHVKGSGAVGGDEPLDLPTLVARARQDDLRVAAARAQLDAFEAQHQEASWAWFPAFTTTMLFGGPVPEARVADGADLIRDPLNITDASVEGDWNFGRMGVLARARMDAALPVWTFGKLAGLETATRKLVDVGAAQVRIAADEAAYDAARAYWSYQAARQLGEGLDDAIARARQAIQEVQELLDRDSEQATVEDKLAAELVLQHLLAQRGKAEEAEAMSLAAIGLLAGNESDHSPTVKREALSLPGELPELEVSTGRALENRPELMALDAACQAREAELEVRRAMFLPDLLVGGYGEWSWSNAATDQRNPFVYDPYNYVTAGAGLLLRQTFDFPQKKARMDRTRAELKQLERQNELVQRAVRLETEKAWRDLRSTREEAMQLEQATRTARRWVIAAQSSFELGIGEVQDLLQPILAWAMTRSLHSQALYRARIAEAQLLKAEGRSATVLGE